ncbi:Phage integrase family protein [Marinomonas gallaica]|uniref:Phage integrase family protein n=1 Tax=Marinomonas gallaica TaxID=1806667 RepID=A0A1C3JSB6_9GAMM|nr:site-specific integrase [Marinomonas gallaica]SBT18113.1 Phage integrase family protein [Marinomonas gallaica]SBT22493.1 Phage integrase family protein [Marinomonas gallaica]
MLPNYERLAKGLAIYRLKNSKNFYARIRVNGVEIKRSLKVADEDEAKFRAWELRSELENRNKQGLAILANKKIYVQDIINNVIENLNNRKPKLKIYQDYKTVFLNFIIPFFQNVEVVNFTTKKIREYFESQELSITRKNINKTCFKMIFDFLEEEKIIKKNDIPILPKIKALKIETRDAFNDEDLKIILEYLPKFHEIEKNGRKANFKTVEYRKILNEYFIILLETGVRTGEEFINLRFNDIKKKKHSYYKDDLLIENDNYLVKITKGKTKKYSNGRVIALSSKAINAIVNIAKITQQDKNITIDNFIYSNKLILETSFNKIAEFSDIFKQFTDYLKESNLINTHYTLYSCRHTFITKRLMEGVDIYLIAKFVGSSVEMIEKHYDSYKLSQQSHIDSLTNFNRDALELKAILNNISYTDYDDIPPDPTEADLKKFHRDAEEFFKNNQ